MGLKKFNYARRIDADTVGIYTDDLTKILQIDKGTANTIILEGYEATGKILRIKATGVNDYPYIDLIGNTNISHVFGATTNFVTVGTSSATGHRLTAGGVHHFKEVTSTPATLGPTYTALYGRDDDTLRWIDGGNVEHTIAFV